MEYGALKLFVILSRKGNIVLRWGIFYLQLAVSSKKTLWSYDYVYASPACARSFKVQARTNILPQIWISPAVPVIYLVMGFSPRLPVCNCLFARLLVRDASCDSRTSTSSKPQGSSHQPWWLYPRPYINTISWSNLRLWAALVIQNKNKSLTSAVTHFVLHFVCIHGTVDVLYQSGGLKESVRDCTEEQG